MDGHFTVDRGSDGTVRGLDLRGPLPVSGRRADLHNHVPRSKKMSEVFNFLESYGNLKRLILNDEKSHKSVENEIEKLTKSIGFGSRKLIKSWRRLKPFFDRRCNLKKIFVIGDTASDLSVFIKNIENGDFDGFIVRGCGFGHANVDDPGSQEFFKVCEDSNIPVVITTGEGVPVSDEYEVARRLFYIYGCIPSGTLNDKEAQVRLASCIGHPEKVKFIHKTAEEFGLEFLDIIRGYYIGGILFKTMNQRLRFERHFNMPTNVEIAASTLFTFEEKILLISMSLSYLQES